MSKNKTYLSLKLVSVRDDIEKKGGLDYLSWARAVDRVLTEVDVDVSWDHSCWPLIVYSAEGYPTVIPEVSVPYAVTPEGYLVKCTVTIGDLPRSAQLYAMDTRSRALIPKPFGGGASLTEINKAWQRCLVKAIALHGLGIQLYSGEDLPEDDGSATGTHNINLGGSDTPARPPTLRTHGLAALYPVLKKIEACSSESQIDELKLTGKALKEGGFGAIDVARIATAAKNRRLELQSVPHALQGPAVVQLDEGGHLQEQPCT